MYLQLDNAPLGLDYLIDAWWEMDEVAGGTGADATGHGNTATWQGALGGQWGAGKINGGGVFNGSDNYLTTGLAQTVPFTAGTWIKVGATSGQALATLHSG